MQDLYVEKLENKFVRELVLPNCRISACLCDISAPWTRINLPSLKLSCLAGCFEYNKPQFENNFFGP